MGMHFGFIAAELPAAELVAQLDARVPRFNDRGEIESFAEIGSGTHDEGWDVVAGDLDGRGYLLDPSYLLSGMEPDLLAGIAAATDKLVIGCCAETVSGSFCCLVARGSEVLRHYYHCHSALDAPYSFGTPLPTEGASPLEHINGDGFLALQRHFGFDYERWSKTGPMRRITWTPQWLRDQAPSPSGPLADAVKQHDQAHQLKREERPSIKLRMTDPQTGKVTEIDTGMRLDGSRTRKKPWWRFW